MDETEPTMSLSLKREPVYGFFPWWPEDGDQWVHPEDVALVRTLLPSDRVFRRDAAQGDLVELSYGPIRFRAQRRLWKEIRWEGLGLGDWVEVRPRGLANEHATGVVHEVRWDEHREQLVYQITPSGGLPLEKRFTKDDLKPVEPVNGKFVPQLVIRPSAGPDEAPLELAGGGVDE
jgi:hypothetical protein